MFGENCKKISSSFIVSWWNWDQNQLQFENIGKKLVKISIQFLFESLRKTRKQQLVQYSRIKGKL